MLLTVNNLNGLCCGFVGADDHINTNSDWQPRLSTTAHETRAHRAITSATEKYPLEKRSSVTIPTLPTYNMYSYFVPTPEDKFRSFIAFSIVYLVESNGYLV